MCPKLPATFRILLLSVLALLATASPGQTTIAVGAGQPHTTIQGGIDAASDGDTVLVAPGTYTENIDFKGKAITVVSSGGAAVTILDGGQRAPAVVFTTAETRASVLDGFTVQHGGHPNEGLSFAVGGLFLRDSSPTIHNNVLTQNNCWTIYSVESAPLIQHNEISATRDPNGNCSFGGGAGIYIGGNLNGQTGLNSSASAMIVGNTIENNVESANEDAGGNGGAGIAVWGGSPVILNNVIRNNASPGGSGGAINVEGGVGVAIVQNLIYGNSAGCGGGALATQANTDPRTGISVLVVNNTIADDVGSGRGGYSNCSPISQIYPSPDSYGYGTTHSSIFLNNIVSGSTSYPAVNCGAFNVPSESNQPDFDNDLIHNGGGPFFGSNCVDVSGKYNNIAADPQFVSAVTGDFHLQSTSPAIDHGQNSALQLFQNLTGLTLATDLDGKPRVQGATGQGCVVDMGAYESAGTTSMCGTAETLTASPNPSTYGQTVTFSAQLSLTNGVPTGDVQFSDGATVLGATGISGTGVSTFSTGQLSVGSHTITAVYQPSGSFAASSASLVQVVNGYASTTMLTSSVNPADVGQMVTLTATVRAANGSPGGTVTFTDGGATLGVATLGSGRAVLSTSTLTAGSHVLTATYSPIGGYAGSYAALTQTINGRPTSTSLSVSPNPATAFGSLTLASTVSAASGVPTGSVSFLAGGVALGSATLRTNGQATLSLAAPLPGSYQVTAAYSGDASLNPSTSAAVSETVLAAPSGTALSVSRGPAYTGQAVSLSAVVTGIGGQIPTGAVRFYDGATVVGSGTLSAAGVAALTVSTLTAGTHTLTASYGGAGGYAGSSSPPVQETILPSGFGIVLTPSAIALASGQQATVQISLTSLGGFVGPLTLSAAMVPTYASASINPGTVTMGAGGSGAAALTLNTAVADVDPAARTGGKTRAAELAGLVVLLVPFGAKRGGRLRRVLGMLLLGLLLTGANGCGLIRIPFHTAAPGSYQVSVTAMDVNHNSQTAVLTVTVTP